MTRLQASTEGLAHQATQEHVREVGEMFDDLALEYAAAHVWYQFLGVDPRSRMDAYEAREALGQRLTVAEKERDRVAAKLAKDILFELEFADRLQ